MRSNSITSLSSLSSRPSSENLAEPSMQIFVKTLSGETFPLTIPTSTPVGTLRSLLSLRTSIPESDLRLVCSGRHLTSLSSPLSAYAIVANSTIDLALPLRGGAPKKPRCQAKECTAPAQKIVGDCGFCLGHFCGKHRMLESHQCPKLEDCKAQEKERNREKLESERTQVVRGI